MAQECIATNQYGKVTPHCLWEKNMQAYQKMLLITEYIQPRLSQGGEVGSSFINYTQMLQEIAQQNDQAEYLDAWPKLRTYPTDEILVDSNHMTQKGNRILGELIAEELNRHIQRTQ